MKNNTARGLAVALPAYALMASACVWNGYWMSLIAGTVGGLLVGSAIHALRVYRKRGK